MSITPARLVFTPPKKKMIASIAIDVFEVETYTRASKMTEYPIEYGSVITDHTINEPLELSIKAFIGVDGQNFYNPLGSSPSFINVFDQINTLIDQKTLITIVMGLDIYDNMHIESFEVERDSAAGQGLPFTMRLRQAKVVVSQTVATSSVNQLTMQANPVVNNGKTQPAATQTQNQILQAFQSGQNALK